MHDFRYRSGRLYCESIPVESLVRKHGTPLYVYSQATVTRHFQSLTQALRPLDHLICFAVKANSNLAILRSLALLGAGFDVVSQGELRRVLNAGGRANQCVFAGVGKTVGEIEFALRRGIHCFNVESEAELRRINQVARRLGKVAPIAIRVNPNVDALTHAKITTGTYENKFGIPIEQIEAIYDRAARLDHIRLRGLQMHIGSQLTNLRPFELAVRRVAPLARRLAQRHSLEFLSIGGGLGIVYDPALASGQPAWWTNRAARGILTPATYASALLPMLQPLGLRVLVEPGRFVTGNAGILVTRVEYVKRTGRKTFVIVDAAMNDLIRPAFYDAYHEIVPLRRRSGAPVLSDVVGPICESGDSFCRDRPLTPVTEGDYLALLSAGAYGSVMSSNYNSRPYPAEVLVHGRRDAVVRKRQPLTDIWRLEQTAPWLDR